MIRPLSLGILLLNFPANAIEPRSMTYFCSVEAAGGLAYDKSSKKWRSATFRPDGKFVLKLQFLKGGKERLFEGAEPSNANYFAIFITEAGSNKERPCVNISDFKPSIRVWDEDLIRCNASLTEYRFNPDNNRFMATYLVGYIDGADDDPDTPSIKAGVCTKIN